MKLKSGQTLLRPNLTSDLQVYTFRGIKIFECDTLFHQGYNFYKVILKYVNRFLTSQIHVDGQTNEHQKYERYVQLSEAGLTKRSSNVTKS